jgi:NADH-quinone oxidoreductase subunit L
VIGLIGTPAWPWFQSFLNSSAVHFAWSPLAESARLMGISTLVVLAGIVVGLWLYRGKVKKSDAPDVLEAAVPPVWGVLANKFYVDEFYGVTVIAFYAWWARVADWLDRRVWGGIVALVAWLFGLWAQLNRLLDVYWVDGGFDKTCEELSTGGGLLASVESGRVQNYLRILAVAVVVLAAILLWSSRP